MLKIFIDLICYVLNGLIMGICWFVIFFVDIGFDYVGFCDVL